jgi:hypothetical protein
MEMGGTMIEYEQQDLDRAREIVNLRFLMDINKRTLNTEEDIIDVAKKYYQLRLRTFDPKTGTHL